MTDSSSASAGGRRRVAIFPAAGRATRLAPLPCSKELLPVGVFPAPESMRGKPKSVSHYLIEKFRIAGAQQLYIVLRSGKWDIADYYGNGEWLDVPIAYLTTAEPWGPPFTVAAAAPFVDDCQVLFGFPDILIQPQDVFCRLVERLESTGADVVLALFRGRRTDALDVVRTDASGRAVSLVTKEQKPPRGDADVGYMAAAWGPAFTRFLVAETRRLAEVARRGEGPGDWPMGTVFAAAIRDGLHVDTVFLSDAAFLDVGTPSGLAAALTFPGVWNGVDAAGVDRGQAPPAA